MRIFVTGGTGLIGRRLVVARLARGDQVVVLSRNAARAAGQFAARANPNVTIVEGDPSYPGPWQDAIDGCDAVVHLAAAGIADKRWNARRRRQIVESRLDGTHQVVEGIRAASQPPRTFVSGSAIGWYGETGNAAVDEGATRPGDDFLARLAVKWEAIAAEAESVGTRVVLLRTGIVLDERGGFLPTALRPFRFFIGGPIGNGRQFVSWVHWRDVIGIIDTALRDETVSGAINATSPEPVTNRELSRAMGGAIGRPSWLPVPGFALRLAIGPMARYALMSQRVLPERAREAGYRFLYEDVDSALEHLLAPVTAPLREDPALNIDADATTESTEDAAPPAPVRLVAISVDGALLRRDGRMPQGVVHACAAAVKAGCAIVLVTARPPRAIANVVRALDLDAPVIAYAGAAIWNPRDEVAQYHEALDAAVAREVIDRARAVDPNVQVAIERLDRWYTDRLGEGVAARSGEPDGEGPLESFLDEPVSQVGLLATAPVIDAIRDALGEGLWRDRRIAVFRPERTLLTVAHPLTDPAIALQRIARASGIEQEAVMAIGGGPEDAGMVEWAGFGVAIAGAAPPVLKVADAVVPDAEDHGVARALRRWVL